MSFKYLSGEDVRVGDLIKYHGANGEVEFVADQITGNLETDWYVKEYPPGGFMMIVDGFGPVFVN